jgi:hypothetical protein
MTALAAPLDGLDAILRQAGDTAVDALLVLPSAVSRDLPAEARIAPPPPGPARPLWTVAIPICDPRDPHHLRAAIESILAQGLAESALEFLLVDDASVGDAAVAMASTYGPRVRYLRNPQRLGLAGNFNRCLTLARGQIVHLLHQDDLVFPGFHAALSAGLQAAPGIGGAFTRFSFVDAAGALLGDADLESESAGPLRNWLPQLAAVNLIQCPAIAVPRAIYETLGGFDPRLGFALDWELWGRLYANSGLWYEPRLLAAFRIHDRSRTGALPRGERLREVLEVGAQLAARLPQAQRVQPLRQLVRRSFWELLRDALAMARQGEVDVACGLVELLVPHLDGALEPRRLRAMLTAPSARLSPVPHRLPGQWRRAVT